LKKYIFIVSFFSIVLSGCQISEIEPFAVKINKFRYTKDSLFKFSQESPFDEKEKVRFSELTYYHPHKDYQVEGKLTKFEGNDTIIIGYTKKDDTKFIKFGKVEFNLKEKTQSLMVYKILEQPNKDGSINLFIPFTDESNHDETYHGGRYLDIVYKNTPTIALDFNMAYNPSCSYSDRFSCPIPPKENHLPIKVEAGEKKYDPFFQ
jgi:hypothetical protein